MIFVRVLRKILDGEIHLLLGRFEWPRRIHRSAKKLWQLIYGAPHSGTPCARNSIILPNFEVEDCITELRSEGIFHGLKLPRTIVSEIAEFATKSLCEAAECDRTFYKDEVANGYLPDGTPVALASVQDPMQCGAVDQIVHDPTIIEIASKYLGYYPTYMEPELNWSFVSDLPMDIRWRLYHTVYFHFDVVSLNYCKVGFYLTDNNRSSGAHVMIKKSHTQKPLRFLLASRVQPDNNVLQYYGADSELVLEGEAGCGFVEDSFCFHKTLVPKEHDRLFLMIDYG